MKTTLTLFAVLLALVAMGTVRAEDEPQVGARWTLELEHGPLRVVAMRGATGQVTSYHYQTIKVKNPGTLARDWYPVVKALTDTGRTYVAMGFEEALPAIRAQEGNDDLVSVGTTKGKIQPGETLDTVAVFGPLDPLYDLVKVQLLGLADPIAIYKMSRYDVPVDLPDVVYKQAIEGEDGAYDKVTQGILIQDVAYVERNKKVTAAMQKELGTAELPDATTEYWEVSERRVFEMVYSRPGDEFRPDDDLISFEREHWRVVGDVKALRKIQM